MDDDEQVPADRKTAGDGVPQQIKLHTSVLGLLRLFMAHRALNNWEVILIYKPRPATLLTPRGLHGLRPLISYGIDFPAKGTNPKGRETGPCAWP